MKMLLTISILSILAISVGCNRGGDHQKSGTDTSASPQQQQDDMQGHHRGSESSTNTDSSTNMNP